METDNYQSRVKKRKLAYEQPELELPKSTITDSTMDEIEDSRGTHSLWLLLLITGLLVFISFSTVQAFLYINDLFHSHWILAGLLSLF